MISKLKGLCLAVVILAICSYCFKAGYKYRGDEEYDRGLRQGRLDVMTDACRSHNAYWRVENGEAQFEWRYVPKWRSTCVKYGGK